MELPNIKQGDGPEPLALKEVATLLVRHYGYHEGMWDVAIELAIGLGPMGPSPDKLLPSAIIGVSRIGLQKATKAGISTVDAAEVNPLPKA